MAEKLSVGRAFFFVEDLDQAIESCRGDGFDFLSLPLCHPRMQHQRLTDPSAASKPFTRPDNVVSSSVWSRFVVGNVSSWIDADVQNSADAKLHTTALEQELRWALHLSLPAVVIPVHSTSCFNTANTINGFLHSSMRSQFWIHVPTISPETSTAEVDAMEVDKNESVPDHDPWHWWNNLRLAVKPSKRLGIVLEVTADLPEQRDLDRWLGEPIKCVILPTSVFLTNAKGFPVLSKAHQAFVRRLMKLPVQFLLSGTPKHKDGVKPYMGYLGHLFRTQPAKTQYEQFTKGYEDYLEIPLQPLMDNLESQTYETFEKDPIKYVQYEKAVYHALLDRVPDDKKDEVVTVVMVVGAGRGPLVRASLSAAKKSKRVVRVYAVEKNPNAVVTLQHLKETEWKDSVTVVSQDMRFWKAPEQADILVSELLGSWGDNELSPECLDGAQRFLKEGGISIPERYTSYVAPVCTHKLHTEVVAQNDPKHLQTPFVVLLHNHMVVDKPKELFVFEHPNPAALTEHGADNSRSRLVSFTTDVDVTIHGFAGYFDSHLYKDIMISIHPDTHSKDMFSWFPMYIPLTRPATVRKGETISAHFWRKTSRTKVWYEWVLTSPSVSEVHNAGGQSSFIGL